MPATVVKDTIFIIQFLWPVAQTFALDCPTMSAKDTVNWQNRCVRQQKPSWTFSVTPTICLYPCLENETKKAKEHTLHKLEQNESGTQDTV